MKLVVHGFGLFTRVCVQSDAKREEHRQFLANSFIICKEKKKMCLVFKWNNSVVP